MSAVAVIGTGPAALMAPKPADLPVMQETKISVGHQYEDRQGAWHQNIRQSALTC
jgi:hypothetical protein